MEDFKALGEFIRHKRHMLKKSGATLAHDSGLSTALISEIENGNLRNGVRPEHLMKLAPALDTTYGKLMKLAGYLEGLGTPEDNHRHAVVCKSAFEALYVEKFRDLCREYGEEIKLNIKRK